MRQGWGYANARYHQVGMAYLRLVDTGLHDHQPNVLSCGV